MQVMDAVWRNFKFVASGSAIAALCGLAAMTLNARGLGPMAFGALVVIQALVELINRFAEFQTWQSIINFGSQDIARGDGATLRSHYLFGLAIDFAAAGCATIVALILLIFFVPLIGLDPHFADYAPVFALACVFARSGAGIGIMRLAGRFDKVMALQSVQAVALLINAAILWWLDASFAAYLWSIAIVTALSSASITVAGYVQMRRLTSELGTEQAPAGVDRKAFIHFSLATSTSGLLNALRQKGEPLLIGALVGVGAVGAYAVAARISLVILRFADAARMSVYPEIAGLVARDQADEARKVAFRTVKIGTIVAIPAYIVVILFGRQIMTLLFGPEFAHGYLSLIFLISAAGIYTTVFAMGPLIQQIYGAGRLLLINLIAFAGFLASTVVILPIMGGHFSGIGSLVFCVVYTGLCMIAAFAIRKSAGAREPVSTDTQMP